MTKIRQIKSHKRYIHLDVPNKRKKGKDTHKRNDAAFVFLILKDFALLFNRKKIEREHIPNETCSKGNGTNHKDHVTTQKVLPNLSQKHPWANVLKTSILRPPRKDNGTWMRGQNSHSPSLKQFESGLFQELYNYYPQQVAQNWNSESSH